MRIFLFLCLLILVSHPTNVLAQANTDSPVEHMKFLTQMEEELSRNYMSYMSEVAHGRRARKLEKRREQVITSIKEALRESGKLRPFKGDASLRDAFREYWNVLLSVFVEDYHKIVDLEEVAERSYDMMEAIILTQEKVDEKLKAANAKVGAAYSLFANRHNVTLTEAETTKLNQKLKQVGLVNKYDRALYLIFFKSTVQETLMIEALNGNNINAAEQLRSAMLKYAEEGLQRLDTTKGFNGDKSLINACRKVLAFQKQEAGKMDALVDFHLKSDELEKIKKAFESKPAAKRTKEDVDAFNAAVNNFNASVKEYNDVNNELNSTRTRVMENWNLVRKRFMDQHIPRA